MKKLIFFILIFFCSLFSQTINSGHPRVWITSADLTAVRAKVGPGGANETLFNTLTSWCDSHISDALNSGTDYDEHLYRYSMAHLLTAGDVTYGDRAKDILQHLADNASGYGFPWSPSSDWSGGDNNAWWYVPSALGIAYDWCYDRINGGGSETDIEDYLQAVLEVNTCDVSWSGTTCGDWDFWASTWHKTEENWGWITLALALHGEQGSTNNSRVANMLAEADDFIITASNDWSGSYVRSYDYITTDGYALYSDGYENDVANSLQYVVAWHTATTDNMLSYPWWANKARGALAVLPPDGSYPKIGEVQPYGTTATISGATYAGNTIWYLAGDYLLGNKSGYFDAILDMNSARANDDWADFVRILWTDGTENYSALPRVYHFNEYGGFAFRSGWDFTSSTDLVGEIRGFKPYPNDHWVAHSGHFDYRRGSDYLLLSGGAYTGSYYNDDTSDDYNQDSDGQNTLHVDNVEHRSRSDGLADAGTSMADDEYGETKRLQFIDGDYVYGLYDLTNAIEPADVNHSTGAAYRSLAFLNDQWVFIHDYVRKINAADPVTALWHMQTEPADDGSGWTDSGQSASTTGQSSTDASVFNFTRGSSECWVRVVEPTSGVTFTKRGGSWNTAFVSIDGPVHTVPQYSYDDWGTWTVETELATPAATEVDMLYVIQAKSSAESETTVERITGTNFIGACVRASVRCAALFSDDGANHNSVTFSVTDNSGTLKATVANLDAGTYNVNGSGAYVVDADGVLYFEANLATTNSFTISTGAGGGGDPPPPIYLSPGGSAQGAPGNINGRIE